MLPVQKFILCNKQNNKKKCYASRPDTFGNCNTNTICQLSVLPSYRMSKKVCRTMKTSVWRMQRHLQMDGTMTQTPVTVKWSSTIHWWASRRTRDIGGPTETPAALMKTRYNTLTSRSRYSYPALHETPWIMFTINQLWALLLYSSGSKQEIPLLNGFLESLMNIFHISVLRKLGFKCAKSYG